MKPGHYKVICISLYTEDVKQLGAKVKRLKERGWTKMSKSQLIRLALAGVDAETLEIPENQ